MQVLHRMRLQPFTPREPISDVQITSQELKPDREVIVKHDSFYASAWESEFGKPTFDNDHDEQSLPKPGEVTVESNQTIAETCS